MADDIFRSPKRSALRSDIFFALLGVFGKMSTDTMLGILNASWAAGYFFYRIRGTTA